MRLMDELHLRLPFYGSRRLTWSLQQAGYAVDRKRVQRLMRRMGMEAIYPRPRTSDPHPDHRIYPYLLRNVVVSAADQVWSADITYVPMPHGFMYLVAILDWHSRYVLAWRLSNTLDSDFCVEALQAALGSRAAGDLQHRPGDAVHQPGLHGRAGAAAGLRSAWMAAAGLWTTCSSSGCGGA